MLSCCCEGSFPVILCGIGSADLPVSYTIDNGEAIPTDNKAEQYKAIRTAVRGKIRNMCCSVLRILVTAYAGLAIALFIFQPRMIYYPESEISMSPEDIGLSYEDVSFRASDGTELSGWFIPVEGSSGTVLFCHGNAGNISHRLDSIRVFKRLGLDIFIFDYRGYGKSGGKPSEQGTYMDAEAAWRYLTDKRRIPPQRIIVFGRSLGGPVAARLTLEHTPGALIVESSFTSIPDIAARYYPYLPVRLISRYRYNTEEYINRVNCPVLIVHSKDDDMIPFSHGLRLFESAREPKQFLEISGSHDYGFIQSAAHYEEGLRTFVSGKTID